MKEHTGVHVCIISRGVPSSVKETIRSCRESKLHIRSICIACFDTERYMDCLQGEDCQVIPLDCCPTTSRKQAMNTIARYYNKKVLFWLLEGEKISCSQPIQMKDESGLLIRIQRERCLTWEMRILALRFPWYFEDMSGTFPTLYQSSAYHRRIGKLTHTMVGQNSPDRPASVGIDIYHRSEMYPKARQALLTGEMEIATHLFKQIIRDHQENHSKERKEEVIRSYLGVAIAHQFANMEWKSVSVYLESGFRLSQHNSLEILYFWIRFARSRKKSADIVSVILNKYENTIYEIQPPQNSTYPYEPELYHYRCLVEWMIVCFENNYFQQAMNAAQELKNRKYIPLEYRESIEFIFDESQEQYRIYEELKNYTSLEKSTNVSLTVERLGEIYVHSSQITNEHLECSVGNKQCVGNGIRWRQENLPETTHHSIKNFSKFQAILHEPLVCKGLLMCGEERMCFPLPWMIWKGKKTLKDIEERQYKNPISHYSNKNIVDLSVSEAFNLLQESLEYDRICLIGTNRWTDIMHIMFCLLHGCMVFYRGKRQIAEIFYPTFTKEVYHVGPINQEKILSIMDAYTIEWSSRSTMQNAGKFTCTEMCLSQMKHEKDINSLANVFSVENPSFDYPIEINQYRYQKPLVYHNDNSKINKATSDYLTWIITQVKDFSTPVDAICIVLPIYVISLSYVRYKFKSTLTWREHFTPSDIWKKDDQHHISILYQKALTEEWLSKDSKPISLHQSSKYYRILYIE